MPQRLQANSNQIPAGVLANGVLTLDLEVREGEWFPEDEHGPSVKIFALAERGKPAQVPGPLVRVRESTTIHARIRNLLLVAVVMHGLHQRPGKTDDVLEVPSGETRDVTFQAGEPGAYYYWASAGGDTLNGRPYKEDSQLSGAFVVDPAAGVPPDRIFVIGAWRDRQRPEESFDIPVINGKSWPYTERLEYTAGTDVRWRWLNASAQVHPMHMHGSYFRVDAMGDGERDTVFPAAQRKSVVTQLIPVGGTMTTYWHPEEPGRWIFHCHILTHISPDTMMLRRKLNTEHTNMSHDDPMQDMAGLVMGITILPRPGDRTHPKPPKPRRRLALVIDNQQGGTNPRGYALSERGQATSSVSAPGPMLVLTQGEPIAIRVTNRLSEATSVHWHGIELQSYYDGVPGWTGYQKQVTPMIQPGKSFDVYFNPPRAGTFIYHTHMNDLSQLSSGLYGPIIVLPPGETFQPETDRIFIISRNGMRKDGGLLLNGAANPQPQQWHAGLHYRLRFININANNTVTVSLTQNGTPVVWRSVAKDGADLPAEQAVAGPASFLVAPGETYDFEVRPAGEGDMELTLDLALLKEKLTQPIRLEPAEPR
ncbi:MAG: multicopper oxidase domain-containing protein [Acidobacteriia bacterium]|nr:multicopper oxidase domain-containing protein [Terriglobia bacterium]